MINILIIEDELLARKKLKRFIDTVCPDHTLVGEVETVVDAGDLLKAEPNIDIIFSDISLRDGNVFDVFSKVTINCPIIFATAYDDYFMSAFQTNGIEYLLKPYNFERFNQAWQKYLDLSPANDEKFKRLLTQLNKLEQTSPQVPPRFQKRFTVKYQQNTYLLNTADIVYFQSNSGIIFAFDKNNKRHIMPHTSFVAIEQKIDPQQFFRINRSEIIQLSYIKKLERYCKNTLTIHLNDLNHTVKTSQKRTAEFNKWLGLCS